MLKFSIFILSFGSAALFLHEFYPYLSGVMERWHKKEVTKAEARLDNMFIDVQRQKLAVLYLISPIALGILGHFILKNNIGIIFFGSLGLIIPSIYLKILEAKRRNKFASQLIDALMILSSSLKAGLSLLQAIETLVEEMPAPISQEFGLVVRENRMGVPFEESLLHLKNRVRLEDLDLIITAVLVARETGGELTHTFNQLIFTIREKNKLLGRVKALCIQAKIQGLIMAVLPFVFASIVYRLNPHFFDVFKTDRFGQMLIYGSVVWWILGLFLIKQFSKVEV